jgi:MFS family permease
MTALAITSSLVAAIAFAALLAAALNTYFSTNNLLLQAMAPSRIRGRVLSFYGFVFWAILPVAGYGIGLLVDRLGVRTVLVVMSVLTFASLVAIGLANRSVLGLDVSPGGAISSRWPRTRSMDLPVAAAPVPVVLDSSANHD